MPYKDRQKNLDCFKNRPKHNAERGIRSRIWREKHYGVKYPVITNCQMCGKELRGSKIQLDHDHRTGLFRGWLCTSCNNALGQYEKIKELAERYLKHV